MPDLPDRRISDEALRASEVRLAEAQRLAHVGSFHWAVGQDTVTWSAELYRIYGLEPSGAGATFATYLDRVHPEDRERVAAAVQRAIDELAPFEHEYRIVRPDATVRWVHARGEAVAGPDGNVERLSGYCQDVTERRLAEDSRRLAQGDLESHQRVLEQIARGAPLRTTLNSLCREVEQRFPGTRCCVQVVDRTDSTLRAGAAPSLPPALIAAIDGLPIAIGMGVDATAAARNEVVVVENARTDPLMAAFLDLVEDHDIGSVWSQPLTAASGEVLGTLALYRSAPHLPQADEFRTVISAGSLAALAMERSISERALTAAAQVDPLTGLPNRNQFLAQLQASLAPPGASVAVMFLDLDRFKWINDSLGHPSGDRILREVATRLRDVLDTRAVLARFGGDEFTVLVTDVTTAKVSDLASRLEAVVTEPFFLDGGEFFLSVSIGIALNDHPVDAYGLVRDADAAMFAAKESGRARHAMFDVRLRERALARVTLETELRRAVERDELGLVFQPILDLATDNWCGVEALVRWEHPTRGLLSPGEFIPLAEETGLIVPMGLRILDMAAGHAAAWTSAFPNVRVGVNISVVQLADPTITAEVVKTLQRHGVDPGRIFLEVTETGLMSQLDVARSALQQIADFGVDVFIDDFGTGYSSIARLGDLPVVGVKVDRSFTTALGMDPHADRVMGAITALAQAHRLTVVTEGIETAHAHTRVRELGCDQGQGFHLGRPVTADELPAVLEQRAS